MTKPECKPPEHGEWTVELDGGRLDAVLKHLSDASWSTVRRWIERGRVRVDGQLQTDEAAPVRVGQRLELGQQGQRASSPAGLGIADRIVFRDQHLVVLDKPAGVSTVPFEPGERGTLEEQVRKHFQELSRREKRTHPLEALLVHRLDRNTSGLIIFALNRESQRRLKSALRVQSLQSSREGGELLGEKHIHRSYLALVHGQLAETRTISSHLVADRGDGRRGSAEYAKERGKSSTGGQLSITHVEPVELFAEATLLRCTLETGRTHQIRIHLSEAGHPLLGETGYMRGYRGPSLEAGRQMLHSASLQLEHPFSGQPLHFDCALPSDMQALCESLRASAGIGSLPGTELSRATFPSESRELACPSRAPAQSAKMPTRRG